MLGKRAMRVIVRPSLPFFRSLFLILSLQIPLRRKVCTQSPAVPVPRSLSSRLPKWATRRKFPVRCFIPSSTFPSHYFPALIQVKFFNEKNFQAAPRPVLVNVCVCLSVTMESRSSRHSCLVSSISSLRLFKMTRRLKVSLAYFEIQFLVENWCASESR